MNGNILLVDDIFTTGATAESAAELLKREGARTVGLFALARTHAPDETEKIPESVSFSESL